MGDSDSESDTYGSQLPPTATNQSSKGSGGATTAQDCQRVTQDPSDSESEDEGEEYCPALPPHMLQGGNKKPTPPKPLPPQRRSLVGPMLPQGFAPPTEDAPNESDAKEEGEEEEEEEEEVVGPLPPVHKVNPEEYRAQQMEERARRMRDKLEGRDVDPNKPIVRETWMTELPKDKPLFSGLGPRQFLRKTPKEKGDRSCWTDTPADRARKANQEQEEPHKEEESTPEEDSTKQRDKELTEKVEEYNKTKRAKPLVDLHMKELKKKQKTEDPKERRPFSREEDLNVNKFDEAQRDTIMKKARQLNDRFSAGKAKFL